MFKLFKNLKGRDWFYIFLMVVFTVLSVGFDLKLPEYISEITKNLQTDQPDISQIVYNGLWMLGCALGCLITGIIADYFIATVSASFSLITRKLLFEKIESFSFAEIKKFAVDSLITRSTNDVTQVETYLGRGLQLTLKAPLTAVWAIIKIYNKNWQWSAVTAVAVAILLGIVISLIIRVIPKFKVVQKLTDKVNGLVRENLNGIRVVRAFNAEKYQEHKFAKTNNSLTEQQLYNQTKFAVLNPAMDLIMNTLSITIYILGAVLIFNTPAIADKINLFADMMVFTSYAAQVIMSFLMLTVVFMIVPRAQISATRINEVLNTKPSIKSGKYIPGKDSTTRGKIEFKDVTFSYPNAEIPVIKNITFTANPGETVAIVGSTGSGKSTLINLIPRFYDATSGEILIDGVNVKDYDLTALYNKLGYIPQRAVMFDRSVADNLKFGISAKKKTAETVAKALEVAQADFVQKMDKKEKSHIAAGGTNISGGQKQRLAIARAIARDPEIYIFDDSFSALDYKTDARLRAELKKQTAGATSIIVAQRIGTVMHADRIIVLDHSEMVGCGTHAELMKKCKVYREIAYSQLSKEELENA